MLDIGLTSTRSMLAQKLDIVIELVEFDPAVLVIVTSQLPHVVQDRLIPLFVLIKINIVHKATPFRIHYNSKVIKSKYNKFKQINKYLEFIKQATSQLDSNKQITILDFGSGKSYLTFSTYYYLTEVLNMNVKIIGIDLKKEVIEHCNNIAKKLNFSNLSFIYGDVIDYENKEKF